MQVSIAVPKGDDGLAEVVSIQPSLAFAKPRLHNAGAVDSAFQVPQLSNRLAAAQRLRNVIRAKQRQAAMFPAWQLPHRKPRVGYRLTRRGSKDAKQSGIGRKGNEGGAGSYCSRQALRGFPAHAAARDDDEFDIRRCVDEGCRGFRLKPGEALAAQNVRAHGRCERIVGIQEQDRLIHGSYTSIRDCGRVGVEFQHLKFILAGVAVANEQCAVT